MRCTLLVLLACATTCLAEDTGSPAVPLVHAHAHNDYEHERPLWDALDHGFCSVEADIFLVGDLLLVGHTRGSLKPERTLQSLYLDPLRQRVAANQGRAYRDGPPLTLLIDVKSDAEQTYRALHDVLTGYKDLVSVHADDSYTQRAVTVVISGNRAKDHIAKQTVRYAGIDGRLGDLESDAAAHLLPLISDRWTSHFKWRGAGPMPDKERQQLRDIVTQAHQRGRRVRFWATPENETVWSELLDAKVDLIGTDDLPALCRFLRARR